MRLTPAEIELIQEAAYRGDGSLPSCAMVIEHLTARLKDCREIIDTWSPLLDKQERVVEAARDVDLDLRDAPRPSTR